MIIQGTLHRYSKLNDFHFLEQRSSSVHRFPVPADTPSGITATANTGEMVFAEIIDGAIVRLITANHYWPK